MYLTLNMRRKLINWLAGEEIVTILNTKVYDIVLQANEETGKNCLFRRNKVVDHDKVLDAEMFARQELARQGIGRSGPGFVLDPSLYL